MARYRDLGATFEQTATPDRTLRNAGNWTIVMDPQVLNCRVALAEVYQITINGPVGSSMDLFRNTKAWNKVIQGWANTYDPQNPLFIRPGDSLFYFWRAPVRWLPTPTATAWLRYDLDLPENMAAAAAGIGVTP